MGEDAKQWQQWFHRELMDVRARLSECEGMHRKDEQRIEELERRQDGTVLTPKLSAFVRTMADRVHEGLVERISNLEEKPGPDFGSVYRRIEALEKDALGRPLWRRIEAIDRGWKDHTWASDHEILGRVIALEKRAEAGPVFLKGDNPPDTTIYGQLPTCGTCRWFKQDDPSLLFDPKRTGLCVAHPMSLQKMAENTCGEHYPR